MTKKYALTKLYGNRQEIRVTGSSLRDFLNGTRDTLEHLVMYQFREQIVVSKPPYKGYKKYMAVYPSEY
tara:strand:- start:35 stop:241 length:207 start_codon:yes stop_codon:yes gene_type:complete